MRDKTRDGVASQLAWRPGRLTADRPPADRPIAPARALPGGAFSPRTHIVGVRGEFRPRVRAQRLPRFSFSPLWFGPFGTTPPARFSAGRRGWERPPHFHKECSTESDRVRGLLIPCPGRSQPPPEAAH